MKTWGFKKCLEYDEEVILLWCEIGIDFCSRNDVTSAKRFIKGQV